MPQTRFVTKKALALGLKPIVVVNKVDKPGAKPDAVINAAFTPTEAEIAEASRIVAAFAAAGDPGVLALDGVMLDRPHLVRARRTLSRAAR